MDATLDAAAMDSAAATQLAPVETTSAVNDSVEALRGDLAAARRQVLDAKRDFSYADAERRELIAKVVRLESQERRLRQEMEQWRQKSVAFEQEAASYAVRENTFLTQLREAHARERDLAVKSIGGRIAATEAENVQAKAQAECRSQTWQAQQLESKLLQRNDEIEQMRMTVRDAHTRGDGFRAEAESLQARLREGLADRDGQKEAVVAAEQRYGVLEARIKDLEATLKAAAVKQVEAGRDVAKHQKKAFDMVEINQRLRLDLQQAIAQAVRVGEVPFYSGGGGRVHAVPAVIEDANRTQGAPEEVPWKTSEADLSAGGPVSPPSRKEYPKNPRSRQLRQDVLNSREEAINHMESLDNPVT